VTEDHQAGVAAASSGEATVDARNPWLGLVSFTEETRSFFFGRDEEVAELARRVQRKLLTVLFGKSGFGKTSILRAGLVPRLRAHGYCPVYVRIAYGRDTPEPSEQIKEAIRRAAGASGEWTQPAVSDTRESLWEFLHHRDDVLHDASGEPLIPLLIFDQFEELFTLAQTDEFGRARAACFIEELADLVENRAPKALEARLDEDENAAERFDFERSDYRVLISLREDYLAPLESLRKLMPSLSQNRLRLAPMTGTQALQAVLRPGRGLVSEEVAAAVVRFVAGGSELANAEIEPSLLSLICRELNDARLTQGREEISLDLLAGSHESILTHFYERSLADRPASVRQIIEDELLTESGFRENVAEETLTKRFEAACATPGALATLVNRRLLRIEERLDVRRVELTHDVLCAIVKASRDQRHEREARAAAEQELQEQRAREKATRHALRRARAVAIGCILLAAMAISAAVYAYLSAGRAHRAELIAQQSRALAEQARSHSEQLLAYLTDDFVRELESFGQLKVIAQFTQRQIDYFHSLPPELRSPETVRNAALALSEHADVVRDLSDYATGIQNAREAIMLLEGLRSQGDRSQPTLVALGRAYTARCDVVAVQDPRGGVEACRRAAAILEPLANGPGATLPAQRAYVAALSLLSWADQWSTNSDIRGALQASRQCMRIASKLGARDLKDLQISANYIQAGSQQVRVLSILGHNAEAVRVGKEVLALADRVLAQRPWFRGALYAKEITESAMGGVAAGELDPQESMAYLLQDQRTAQTFLSLDPQNVGMHYNLSRARREIWDSLWARGQLQEALDWYPQSLEQLSKVAADANSAVVAGLGFYMTQMADEQAVSGDLPGALRSVASTQRLIARLVGRPPPGSFISLAVELVPQAAQAEVALERGDLIRSGRLLAQDLERVRSARAASKEDALARATFLYELSDIDGRIEYQLGHFVAAEGAERAALKLSNAVGVFDTAFAGGQDSTETSTWLSMALARQGKLREAAQVIDPVVSEEEKDLANDHGDIWIPYELARALYAQSLAEPAKRATLLERAAALLQGLPPPLRKLHDVRQWRQWVLSTGKQ
jgi:hypothetical protein